MPNDARELQFSLAGTLKLLFEPPQTRRGGAMVTLTCDGFSVTAKGEAMSYKLPADKRVHVKVSYVDAGGNPALVDGDVEWNSSDENIAIVDADETDTSLALVTPIDVGQVQISAIADADLGDGVRQLVTIMDVEIISGEAVAGVITPVGEPEAKPQPKS